MAAVCGGDAGRNRYGTEEVGDEMVGLSAAGAFPFGVKIYGHTIQMYIVERGRNKDKRQ